MITNGPEAEKMQDDRILTAVEAVPGRARLHRYAALVGPHTKAFFLFLVFFAAYFLPATMAGTLLAPGDGIVSYFPALYRDWSLWSPNMWSGYPAIGDLQFMMWYPLRYLVPDYNTLVLSAYVAAAFCTFGLAYRRSGDFWAGIVAGLIYGSGGFMMAHLGHLTVIHTAAWVPLVIWAIDALSTRRSAGWLIAGTAGVALCFLGGHPQIFVYGMLIAGAFGVYRVLGALFRSGPKDALILSVFYVAMVVLGVALVAIQVLPLFELQALSQRSATWSYSDFITFSMPFDQLPSILFPYLYGGDGVSFPSYFGKWNLTELTTFAGLGTLFLVVLNLLRHRQGSDNHFWLGVGIVAILVISAGASPVGEWLFETPIVGSFRATARAAFVFNLAVAMLAGAAVALLRKGEVTRSQLIAASSIALLLVAVVLLYSWPGFWEQAIAAGVSGPRKLFVQAVVPPLAALLVTAGLAYAVFRWRQHVGMVVALTVVLAADLALFGQFYEWKTASPAKSLTQTLDPAYQKIADEVEAENGRIMPLFAPATPVFPLTTSLNDYFGIPSVGGYGPLMPSAYAKAIGFQPDMNLSAPPGSSALVAAGVSHVVFPADPVFSMMFGGCDPQGGDEVSATLPAPVRIRALRVVSNMSCSVGLPNGKVALTIGLGSTSESETLELQAGRDTAEWAYDRPDVLSAVQHAKPQVESSFDAGDGVTGRNFVSDLALSETGVTVDRISLSFPAGLGAAVSLKSLSFIGEDGALIPIDVGALRRESDYALNQEAALPNGLRVARFGKGKGAAWLVGRTLPVSKDVAAETVRSGRLPDGAAFQPADTALVEEGIAPMSGTSPQGTVKVSKKADAWSLEVSSDAQALLVVSQAWHPGWHATVNGQPAAILRTNAAFQGVLVGAGKSKVELTFLPASFVIGIAITGAAALALLVMGLISFVVSRRRGARRPGSKAYSGAQS